MKFLEEEIPSNNFFSTYVNMTVKLNIYYLWRTQENYGFLFILRGSKLLFPNIRVELFLEQTYFDIA